MSSRVTRSSAKLSADSSLAASSTPASTSTSTSAPTATPSQPVQPRAPPATRKRKAQAREPSPEAPEEAVETTSARGTKRQRRIPAETPTGTAITSTATTIESTSKGRRKGKASAVMANTGASTNSSDEIPSPPTASSSSKRKFGKSKTMSKEQPEPGPTSTNRRSRPSSAKKGSESGKKTTVGSVDTKAEQEVAAAAGGQNASDSNGEDEGADDYDDDDPMDEDPFESSFLGRHGGHSGMSSTLRALSGIMSGMTSRFRHILENLRQRDDPSIQLVALSELSDILLVSTEDNLAGHFAPDQYVKELVALMQPSEFGEENPEMMLVACRCIANMMEALPASTASVVYGGAVPVLLSKLLEIQYMDLAEQALITLEKISADFPGPIVREGGLTACLTYLDFFATSTQRTAVTTAANCCRNIPSESFYVVKDVMPILQNVLNSNDQRVVEQASLCVSRIVESFKNQDQKLEEMMSTDLLRAILRLLLPGSTNMIAPHIHTQFLRVLSITARASPLLTVQLFKMNIVDTLYQILTGVSPPSGEENVAQRLDSVVIMQALIHRPREQVFETLNVVCELLPGVGNGGIDSLEELREQVGVPRNPALPRSKPPSVDQRLHMLADIKDELRRFAVILLPTLTDAYSSTVNLNVRQKVLTAQLKMLSHLNAEILGDALRHVPYASFLASILSQQDHPFLVTAALQAADLLLERLGSVYEYQFHREGVITEVRKLADRSLEASASTQALNTTSSAVPASTSPERLESVQSTSHAAEPVDVEENISHVDSDADDDHDPGDDLDDGHDDDSSDSDATPPPNIPLPQTSNIQDMITRFAQKFIEQYENGGSRQSRTKAAEILETLRRLVCDIADCYDTGRSQDGAKLFIKLAKYFEGDALESVTSYELLTSKAVSTLLDVFEMDDGRPNEAARSTFVEVFMGSTARQIDASGNGAARVTPFSVLVSKLQDLLSRAEHFEVLTVHSNSFDSNRSSAASMLAKQIRVKLTADDASGIPRTYRNIMISIHAIANFKALDDYLRPRIIIAEQPRPSRHGMASVAGPVAGSHYTAAMTGLIGSERPSASGSAATPQMPPPRGSVGPGNSTRLSSKSKDATVSSAHDDRVSASPADTPQDTRRSNRKSKTETPQTPTPSSIAPPIAPRESDDLQNALECADEAQLSDGEDIEESGGLDTIVGELEEEIEDDESDPSAVTMEVASTGKVIARQEDGTRIATPTHAPEAARPAPSSRPYSSEMARSLLSSLSGRAMSYAAALQTIPQDWHLEFSVNGQVITNDSTIYRAVHLHQNQPDEFAARSVWSALHSISYRRVPGPPAPEPDTLIPPSETSPTAISGLPHSLDKNPTTASILRLLHILHEMNANLDELLLDERATLRIKSEPLAQFVNTKLTAKLNRQLEEPLIVASSCLPSWSEDLARLYPFLFPFETRHLFLQSTSFGYSRSMTRWQNSQTANDSRRDRRRDERPYLGRLQRQKVRISRMKILESAVKVMELYGASPSIIEVEYFDEVGTGLGPTLEFYSTVSKEFSKKKLRLWRENESNEEDEFAFGLRGLFPAPMSEEQANSDNGQKVLVLFKMLGKFIARSMLDSRMIDVSFNPTFFRVNSTTHSFTPSLAAVKSVDQDLAQSLQILKQFAIAKKRIDEQQRLSPAAKAQKTFMIQVGGATVEDLSLDFTLPGYPHIELVPNGANVTVTIHNVGIYVDKVIEFTVGRGVKKQVEAFRAGFSQVFPYSALSAFTPDELVMLFGKGKEDWSLETLTDSIKADHGYNLDSKTVRNLLQTMSELSPSARRDFLQFVTGSPKLPIGGFKSLTPMFTVVCKPSEPPYTSDDYLPSVMTCVNYLKMPDYSTLDVLSERLSLAIKEGQGAFLLS